MRFAIAIALALCAFGFAAPIAPADVFEVRMCTTSGATPFTATNRSAQTMTTSSQCPASPGVLLSGIYASSRNGTFTPDGAWSGWTLSAPAGLTLRRLDVRRSIGTRRDFWRAVVRTDEGTVLDSCELGDLIECRHGDPSTNASASYVNLSTRGVTFAIECRTTPADLTCPGRSQTQAWAAVYSATALVDDPAPPTVAPLGVAAGWHSGTDRLDVGASDASGVKSLSVFAGATKVFERQQACDYTRMQPCPAGAREAVSVDTSKLDDGTYELKAVATDAADQAGTATAVLKVDRHAPGAPLELAVERTADGTLALAWRNPDQGAAAPVAAAHYAVCDAGGAGCVEAVEAGAGIARVGSISVPAGPHVIKVWLQDEAGNADPANAATTVVDPAAVLAPRAIDLNPPVLDPGPAAPALRVKSARRRGSTLTLTGTIARGATARITAKASRGRTSSTLASARTSPKRGRWTLRLRLTSALRRSSAFYVTVAYAGQKAFSRSTIRRRLVKKPRTGGTSEEFSLEARSRR